MSYEVWVSRDNQAFVQVGNCDTMKGAQKVADAAARQGYRYEIVDAKTKALVKDNYQ